MNLVIFEYDAEIFLVHFFTQILGSLLLLQYCSSFHVCSSKMVDAGLWCLIVFIDFKVFCS